MNYKQLTSFFKYLAKNNILYSPVLEKPGGRFLIQEVTDISEIDLNGRLPDYPWREQLLPQQEILFNIQQNKLLESDLNKLLPQVLLGVGLPDLRALTLYDLVFEKDKYYQARKRKTLVVGYINLGAKSDYTHWHKQYEENILEHLKFDVFIEIVKTGQIKVFSGSEKGQKILEAAGIKDYQHIDYAGAVLEGKLNQEMVALQKAMQSKYNKKLWQSLGKKCLACGKCALVCPTCFCFYAQDQIELDKGQGKRTRCWDTCFYNNFSKVAGGNKFQDNNAKRIHFWYEHKFVRIPAQFQISGCVGCGRCTKACPVSIDILKTKKTLLKDSRKK